MLAVASAIVMLLAAEREPPKAGIEACGESRNGRVLIDQPTLVFVWPDLFSTGDTVSVAGLRREMVLEKERQELQRQHDRVGDAAAAGGVLLLRCPSRNARLRVALGPDATPTIIDLPVDWQGTALLCPKKQVILTVGLQPDDAIKARVAECASAK
jgi:hypothetical protein